MTFKDIKDPAVRAKLKPGQRIDVCYSARARNTYSAKIETISDTKITIRFEDSRRPFDRKEVRSFSFADDNEHLLIADDDVNDGSTLIKLIDKCSNNSFPLPHDVVTQSLVVDRKRWKRYEKQKILPNIFVLEHSHNAYFSELKNFLIVLKKQLKHHLEQFRAQLLVRFPENHWAVIDVYIANGSIRTLTLDAANANLFFGFPERKVKSTRRLIIDLLKKYFPNGKHYSFTENNLKQRMQHSESGCNVFAIEHANKLSVTSPDELYQTIDCISSWYDLAFTFTHINKFPESSQTLVPLLLGTQSLRTINSLPARLLVNTPVGKNNLSMQAYTQDKSDVDDDGKQQSRVIQHKSEKKAKQLREEYSTLTHTQCDAIKAFRTGIILIENHRLFDAYNTPQNWGQFLKELLDCLQDNSEKPQQANNVENLSSELCSSIESYLSNPRKSCQRNFIDFKTILHLALMLHEQITIEYNFKVLLGRALRLSEFYIEDQLPDHLKLLSELPLENMLSTVESLIGLMPLDSAHIPSYFQQKSAHASQHENMKTLVTNTRTQACINGNHAVLTHSFLKEFVTYTKYININCCRSKQVLETFSVNAENNLNH